MKDWWKDDAPRLGVPHQWSNLGMSPQTLLEGVSHSSLETKKKRDFQYWNDEGRPLMILASLAQGTSLLYPYSLDSFKRYKKVNSSTLIISPSVVASHISIQLTTIR